MRPLLAAAFLAALAAPALAQDGPVTLTPEQVGQIFCLARSGNDMAPATALLTDELTAAIATADAHNADWEAANPGEKPPLGDGIPWQSYPDYASICEVESTSLEMDESRVRIRFGFPEAPDADFTDTLYLRLVPGPDGWTVWRIDDIAYATDGTLKSALLSAFMD